jgi:hypothetical protein
MTSELLSSEDRYDAFTWNLLSFTINHEYKSSGPSRIYIDRANGEFGIISPSSIAVANLAQFPDDEPIYFQGKNARAASWRVKCKKVTLLFEFLQVDLDFVEVDCAHAFVHSVEAMALAAGNHYFSSYEMPL